VTTKTEENLLLAYMDVICEAQPASMATHAVLEMSVSAELGLFGDHLDVASDSSARLDLA